MKIRTIAYLAVLVCMDGSRGLSASTMQALVRDLRAPVPAVRRHAVVGLGRLGDADAVPALCSALADTDTSVRREAAKSLGLIKAPGAAGALLVVLRDKDKNVRAYAAYALGEICVPRAAGALVGALGDSEWCVRDQAAWALRALRSPATAEALVDAVSSPDANLARITWILKGFSPADTLPALRRLLSVSEPAVRQRAVGVLAELQPKASADTLIPILRDADPGVRLAVVQALVNSGDERVEELLRGMLKREEDTSVRPFVEKAVRKLSRIESLSAHWSFDDRNASTARDVTGGGTDGVIKGCTPVEGKVGQALRFGKGKYIELDKPPALNIGNAPFTVMAWVKSEARDGVIVARGGAFCGYSLYIKDGVARFGIHRVEDGPTYIARGKRSAVGDWVHVAGVVKRDGIELYMNGALEATAKTPGYIPGNCGQGMEIGFDVSNSAAEITDPFEGIIDEVKVYNAELNAKDIAKLFRVAE